MAVTSGKVVGITGNQQDLAAHEGPSLWFSLVGGEPISSFTNFFSDNDIVSAIMPQI